MKVLVAQLCPALCDPMYCCPPVSSVHGILLSRILEWVAIPFSRRASWLRDWTQISCITGRFFTIWTTREVHQSINLQQLESITTDRIIKKKKTYSIILWKLWIWNAYKSTYKFINLKACKNNLPKEDIMPSHLITCLTHWIRLKTLYI